MPSNKYDILPDGKQFEFWECKTNFNKTYYVSQNGQNASDENPGTKDLPFLTIGKAAEVLKPGERVLIDSGVYKEFARPAMGGTGPDQMISYEALPGAKVVISGTEVLKTKCTPSVGWKKSGFDMKPDKDAKVWQAELPKEVFVDTNPFAMSNMPHHPYGGCPFLFSKLPKEAPNREYMMRRGMIFVDGKPLEQIVYYFEMWSKPGTYWVEDDGLTVHFRLADDSDPAGHMIEYTVREQLFMPRNLYSGYIRVKGLDFERVGNGFPGSQRGALSTNCGHHWIIEDNNVHWANSIGIDIGHVNPFRYSEETAGYHIVRNNVITDCGISGLCGVPSTKGGTQSILIENNRFERNCWHNTEFLYECAAVKFHFTRNCLIRHNTIIDNGYGVAIWIDMDNINTRICNNIIVDCNKTIFGTIFVEGSFKVNLIDNNVIWGVGADPQGEEAQRSGWGGHGIYEHDSDYLKVEENFIFNAEGSGIYLNYGDPDRVVNGRMPTGFRHRVMKNIIGNCKWAVVFPTPDNFADGNIYGKFSKPGPLMIRKIHTTQESLNLEAWRDFHGWDMNGKEAQINAELDKKALILKVEIDDGTYRFEKTIDLNKEFSIGSFFD